MHSQHATGVCTFLATWCGTALAAPILFSQMPTGSTWREPAPNVIISVDDSGSMAKDVRGCAAADWPFSVLIRPDYSSDGNFRCEPHWRNPNPSRLSVLRNSLFNTFGNTASTPPSPGLIADGSIRLAWQALHDNGNSIPNHGASKLTPGARNTMRAFSGTHRTHFNAFVQGLAAQIVTPSHRVMNNAFQYMRSPKGPHSPWADQPGVAQTSPYVPCRRSYHIFLSDGGWTWNGEMRSTIPVPDVTVKQTFYLGDLTTRYDSSSLQTRVYQHDLKRPRLYSGTLSDFAFLSWATDLQDGSNGTSNMPNTIRPLIRHTGKETFTTPHCAKPNTAPCATLEQFWNPRNDPATWQHLTLYTIGFGKEATEWNSNSTTTPQWDSRLDDTYGGGFAQLANGEVTWGDVFNEEELRPSELWHMALNGRGKYFPARNADALSSALREILGDILVNTGAEIVISGTNTNELGSGVQLFQAGFDGAYFSGSLVARGVDPNSGAIQPTIDWDAAAQLDAMSESERFIFSSEGGTGYSWERYVDLPSSHKNALNTDAHGSIDTLGEERWRYLRGDRSREAASGGRFRDRSARLGDMVHSTIWFTGKPQAGHRDKNYTEFRSTGSEGKGSRVPMVYVGANDGMLHGFAGTAARATSQSAIPAGRELLAYIPAGIAKGPLRSLTDRNYTHRYFVDGSVFTGDAQVGQSADWTTVLVGTLGAGGKGYFILDVTDPAAFLNTKANKLVLLDTTDRTTDPDQGHIFSPPVVDDTTDNTSRQIVKMNNDRWAVLLGNGYNSNNEAPVLLIQYLNGERERVKLSPCTQPIQEHRCAYQGDNGLSPPQAIDLNGDGKVDVAYAGDLRGHLWKFDLSSGNADQWGVALQGAPFFTAQHNGANRQAITTAPLWRRHPQGGIMLVFGTGRDLSQTDPYSTATDTLYGLHDNSQFTVSAGKLKLVGGNPVNRPNDTQLPATLVAQSTDSQQWADGTRKYYASSVAHVDYTGQPNANPPVAAHRGWYMNLPFAGQRVLHQPRGFSGEKVLFQSTIPAFGVDPSQTACTPQKHQRKRAFLSVLNLFTGKPAATAVFRIAPDALIPSTTARNITMVENSADNPTLVRSGSHVKLLPTNCPSGQTCDTTDLQAGQFSGVRAGWHQVQ